jgi:archaellum component FlaG (FlaF/FlaG flagellin family)
MGYEMNNLYDFFILFVVMSAIAASVLLILTRKLQKLMNKKMKEIDDLVKQGYEPGDAERIVDGIDPKDFKKVGDDMTAANMDAGELGGEDAGGAEDIPGLEL